MNKDKAKQVVAFIGFPVVLGIFCVAFALWILPKNCTLFISNVPGAIEELKKYLLNIENNRSNGER